MRNKHIEKTKKNNINIVILLNNLVNSFTEIDFKKIIMFEKLMYINLTTI
jgi:hypothetical protein